MWFINQGSSDVHSLEFENEAVEAGQQHLSDKPEDASQNKATRHFTLVPVHFLLRCFPVQSLRDNVSEISFFFLLLFYRNQVLEPTLLDCASQQCLWWSCITPIIDYLNSITLKAHLQTLLFWRMLLFLIGTKERKKKETIISLMTISAVYRYYCQIFAIASLIYYFFFALTGT